MDVRELIRKELSDRSVSRSFFASSAETIEKEYGTDAIRARLDQKRSRKRAPRELWYYYGDHLFSGRKSLVIAPPGFMALLNGDMELSIRWLPGAREEKLVAGIIHPDRRQRVLDPFAYCVSYMDLAAICMPFMETELLEPLWERFLEAVEIYRALPEPDTTWYCTNINAFQYDHLKSNVPKLYSRLRKNPHIASLILECAAPLIYTSLTRVLLEQVSEDLSGVEYDPAAYQKLWAEKKKYMDRAGIRRIQLVEMDRFDEHVEKWKKHTGEDYVIPEKDLYARRQVRLWALDICRTYNRKVTLPDSAYPDRDLEKQGIPSDLDDRSDEMGGWDPEDYVPGMLKRFVDAVRFEGDMSWRGATCVCETVIRLQDPALLEEMVKRGFFCDKDLAFLWNLARESASQKLLRCLERMWNERRTLCL